MSTWKAPNLFLARPIVSNPLRKDPTTTWTEKLLNLDQSKALYSQALSGRIVLSNLNVCVREKNSDVTISYLKSPSKPRNPDIMNTW